MAKLPIEIMLDAVEFTPIERSDEVRSGELYATHEGTLTIGEQTLRVFVLNTNERVFDADDITRLFNTL